MRLPVPKRFAAGAAFGLALTIYVLATVSSAATVPDRCRVESFRPFSAAVWSAPWQRGAPSGKAIRAKRRRIECAPPGHRRAMQKTWNRDRAHYYARRAHCLSGPVFAGRVSEFSGGATADGVHAATEPGIALRSESTLGDTFRLRTEAGTDYTVQIDWGPASSTGRQIDITSAEMAKMGWVPTDSWGEAKLIPGNCL